MHTPTSTSDDTLLGGRYRLLYPLGEGGSATVFEALDEKLGMRVAIKLLSEHDPAQREAWRARFDAEVSLTARQQHPNIVRVMDTGTSARGEPFLVMELLMGHTLAHELWQHGPLERERALRLLKRLLHALGSLHNAGVVHRDLKPSNLFITAPRSEAEDIKLLDLGIAFDLSTADHRHTKQDERVGTPAYMAPEYEAYDMISPAGDVYQAALIALELLTGSGAEPVATRLEALERKDRALAAVLSCALADDPDERYPVASALLDAIKALEAPPHEAIPLPETAEASASSAPLKRSLYTWHLGITAVTLILGGALLMSRLFPTQAPEPTAEREPPASRLTPPQPQPLIDSTPPAKPAPQPEAPQAQPELPTPQPQDVAPGADQGPLTQPKRQLKAPQPQPKVDVKAPDPLKEQLKQELLWMEHGEH